MGNFHIGKECMQTAAFPPIFNILCPASEANGWVHATMPLVLCTTLLRLGNWTNGGSPIGKMACALKVFSVEPIMILVAL